MAGFGGPDAFHLMSSTVVESDGKIPKKSNPPKKPQETDEAKKRAKDLRQAVEERVSAEKRAHQTVLLLIEDHVTVQVLQDAAKFIDGNYYGDIVTERAIDKLCGYPICPNRLKCDPYSSKQQYQINVSTNTVYDVAERKCFCSSRCYAASVLYQKQLSETPVWLRANERMEKVRALQPGEVSGVHGKSINLLEDDAVSKFAAELKALNLRDEEDTRKGPGSSSGTKATVFPKTVGPDDSSKREDQDQLYLVKEKAMDTE
ncbi:putative RNA polymerase II subunit B1 CTD phosphatase RPAP2 [Hypsibius exemplaris]|uniref:RNA polymerase II subunit B1 CTD phosphatase RPAP2 homolog n=1 Tax=Hypsibius exemplaris TaxID=2072580 RepID=A0A1W0X9K0_HYPEX|nr:putative RNA polymerase II subunit B1 CTD phosphatase RPAP2 [Hypsibius exemplaris]